MKNVLRFGFPILVAATLSCQQEMRDLRPNSKEYEKLIDVDPVTELDHRIENENPKTIVNKNYDLQLLYIRENLKIIAEGLLKASNDIAFRGYVYGEVEKKFDGEYEALFSTIFSVKESPNARVNNIVNELGKSKKISNALNAFKGINSENFHPQLYIPFYNKNKLSSNARLASALPTIIIYDGDEDVTSFQGYKLENNKLVSSGVIVDEEYAKNNEVWVVSLNEKILYENENGRLAAKSITKSGVNAYIDKMTIRDAKESWVAGKSDIEIHGVSTFWNGDDPITGQQNFAWRVFESENKLVRQFKFDPEVLYYEPAGFMQF